MILYLIYYVYSYILEDKRGIFPACEYLFDLKLPADYQPVNADGEVGAFELMTIEQVVICVYYYRQMCS